MTNPFSSYVLPMMFHAAQGENYSWKAKWTEMKFQMQK